MAVRKFQTEKDAIFFVTFTCYKWMPLFELTQAYDSIYKWFEQMKTQNVAVVGYVIMPNHLHIMLYIPKEGPVLNTLIANGKRFLAYKIVSRLKGQGLENALHQLRDGVIAHEKKHGKKHRVFEPSFDSKLCESRKFILQKLNYIHRNPVSGKWNLSRDWVQYPHSSAGQYELGEHRAYKVVDFRDLRQ